MTPVAETYGQALYTLALEEGLSQSILQQLQVLQESFAQTPEYIRLLSSPTLSKEERCGILDEVFRDKVQPYLLNFMKILTEKGYMGQFDGCCRVYARLYDRDNGILPVTVTTALPLPRDQARRLEDKLADLTGKTIRLEMRVEESVLGGIRLEYDGKLVDDTVVYRLERIGRMLKETVI